MPNWDDQFDFEDLDDNKKKGKGLNKVNDKKKSNQEDDFFDDEQNVKKKQTKSILPTINSRNSAKIQPNKQQSSSKANPYANKSFGNKQTTKEDYEYYDQEQIQEQVSDKKQAIKASSKQISKPVQVQQQKSTKNLGKNKSEISDEYNQEYLQEQVDEPFHQSIKNNQSSKSIKNNKVNEHSVDKKIDSKNLATNKLNQNTNKSKPVNQEEDQYQEEFQGQQYGEDDFQEEPQSPVKKLPNKLYQKPQKQNNLKLNLKTPQIPKPAEQNKNKQPVKTNNLTSGQNNSKPPARGQSLVPPKPPGGDKKINKQAVISNKNIHKVQSQSVSKPLKRSSSRQSIRSNGQKSIKGSRITTKNQSQYFPNKHIDMVSKSFPHDEQRLNLLSQIEINKINEKMRGMIRKFNQELNDLINKNMLLLKNKSLSKQQSIEDKIRELEIQKKSGQTAIEVMEKDFDKLHGREGQLKEQEYQLILQRQIQQKKNQIKQTTKQITVLKRQVDNKGKKLSVKEVQQRNAQNIHHLKTILIQTKKDEQKGDQKIQKLTSNQQELQTKISDMDYKLDELISQAKEKGVNIENTDQLQKKYEDLKTRLENVKNFNKKAQSLNNTKIDILNHQNEQVRIMIRNISSQISNLYGSIDHSQSQAIKLIQKAKQKQGINPVFAQNLDKLLKQLQQSKANNDYYDARSEVRSRRSDSTKNKTQKSPAEENNQKSMPLRVTQSQNRLVESEQHSTVKPKFLKKKPGDQPKLDIQNKSQINQRVWNQNQDEIKNKTPKNDQNRRSVQDISKKESLKEKTEPIEQDKKDKSKPFMLKKNKPADGKPQTNQQKPIEQSPTTITSQKISEQLIIPAQLSIKQQLKKQQPSISLAPKMMRFGRKKNDESASQNNIVLNDGSSKAEKQLVIEKKQQAKPYTLGNKNQGLKLQIAQPPKQVEEQGQKPIFVPKRFNLRNKADKKDDSYTPSVQKDNSYVSSVQTNNVQKQQASKQQAKQEYKPKFDFKGQQFKVKEQTPAKKQPEKIMIQEPQIKPRFNLRLRDRANKSNQEEQSTYAPNIGGLNKNLNGDLNIQPQNKKAQVKVGSKFNAPKNDLVIPNKQISLNSNDKQQAVNNPYNPYAPKSQNKNVQVPKETSPNKIDGVSNPVNNPYAAKFQSGQSEGVKRQRGPLKKNKITSNVPKQSFNIYAQADDITNEVKEIGAVKTANQNVYESAINNKPVNAKKQELNLNEMLGIKKEAKKNDFDDLLGDIGGGIAKNKKKNNDFFSDMQF